MRGNTRIGAFVIVLCVFFCAPSLLFAAELIKEYDVDIDVHNDSSVRVLETIQYDFAENEHHGIYRNIPVRYRTPYGTRGVDVEVLSISRDGFPEPYTTRRDGSDLVVRIGDAGMTIRGIHTYRITYDVRGAWNAFAEYDEFYWDAIGTEWAVPMERASVRLTAPADILQAACYEGYYGSNIECRDLSIEGGSAIASTFDLQAGSGMTIAVALPKGAITLPGYPEKILRTFRNNYILILPFIVFFIMYRIWEKKGKDAKGRGTIVAEYEPPAGLTPLFVGSIVDGALNDNDIAAGIIYLATQGYLKIARTERKILFLKDQDYEFKWVGDVDELNEKERLVAKLIFGDVVARGETATLSDLRKDRKVNSRRSALKKHIDSELESKGYYANKPAQTQGIWIGGGVAFILLVFFLGSVMGVLYGVAIVASGIVVIIFGTLMPKLTEKGALTREHILGFKEFLMVTEKDRLAFHNAPEQTTTEFMEFLPFAIALGVEEKWAEQFKNIELDEPDWYYGGTYTAFTATNFAKDLSSFNTSMHAGVTAAQGGSGSGGGGFSGGGMGGGGGGSW